MNKPADHSIHSLLKRARKQLQTHSDSPILDAELLLAHCLEKNRTFLHTWPEHILEKQQRDCFEALLERRLTDYPVAYLIGKKAFWTLDLIVTPDVLIPRPETELLVETALDKIKHLKSPKILDLGTGSGAIALALACERPDATIIATDNSNAALGIAKKNAEKHQLSSIVSLIQSDWFSTISDNDFDLIVSNPPYIAPDDPHLSTTIRHEPQQALVADNMGFTDLEQIIKNSPAYLKHEGWLMVEHGFEQAKNVLRLFNKNGFINEDNKPDLNHHPRVSFAQFKK